ncbi:MAG: type II toxin-antitoxin system RelE/ParE family toxin [Gemmataceae bacterium]|nr:type II toxin-antitoxin system RelE/ParE family toxin [Gemmataceae bacterium]
MARKRKKSAKANDGREQSRYEVILAPDAVNDLAHLRAFQRSQVRDAMEQYLRHQPTQVSKARIKRLRGLSKPQYRLRVGDELRVFYDVHENRVEVLAIIAKADMQQWLDEKGTPE